MSWETAQKGLWRVIFSDQVKTCLFSVAVINSMAKSYLERKGIFTLHFHITVYHCKKPKGNLEIGTKVKTME